jgi:hypothetical protein
MTNELLDTSVSSSTELKIDVIQLKKAALILRAINHKLRQQIMKLIHQNGKMTVTDRKAGYVNTLRDGKFIFYSVNYERLEQVHVIVHDLLK